MTVMPAAADFDFATATAAVNMWRGRCIAAFSRAETAATDALLRLSENEPKLSPPLLVGQRFSTLASALNAIDSDVAKAAAIALARFRERDELRAFLCHGDAKITIDRARRWQAVFTTVSVKRNQAKRAFLVIEECEADMLARTLWHDQRIFSDKIRRLAPAAAEDLCGSLRIGNV